AEVMEDEVVVVGVDDSREVARLPRLAVAPQGALDAHHGIVSQPVPAGHAGSLYFVKHGSTAAREPAVWRALHGHRRGDREHAARGVAPPLAEARRPDLGQAR